VSHQQDSALPPIVHSLKVSDDRKLDCLKQYILRSIPRTRTHVTYAKISETHFTRKEPASDAVEDLNDLTDEEVEQVYEGTVRESARSSRR
jgi:hypothetical protein